MTENIISQLPGIYIIRNSNNGRFYIGSAKSLRERWSAHVANLNAGTHHNPRLQAAWKKHGASAFTFEVLEVIEDTSLLVESEQRWMDYFDVPNSPLSYNIRLIAHSNIGVRHSPQARERMSAAQRVVASQPSRRAISSQIITQYNFSRRGIPKSDQHRQRISESNKGKKMSEIARQRLSAARKGVPLPNRRGIKHTPESRKKMSDSHIGRNLGADHPRSRPVCQFTLSDEFVGRYASATDAARLTGINRKSITNCLGGWAKTGGGFLWRYEVADQ